MSVRSEAIVGETKFKRTCSLFGVAFAGSLLAILTASYIQVQPVEDFCKSKSIRLPIGLGRAAATISPLALSLLILVATSRHH
jgi:hypothetical protein